MLPISALAPTLANAGFMPRVDLAAGEGAELALQRMGIGSADGTMLPLPDLKGPPPSDRPFGVTPGQSSGDSFGSLLSGMMQKSNAADAVRGLQSGENGSLHQAVIAMEEANVSFQIMVEVRNKLLEAYQELMRMQI